MKYLVVSVNVNVKCLDPFKVVFAVTFSLCRPLYQITGSLCHPNDSSWRLNPVATVYPAL